MNNLKEISDPKSLTVKLFLYIFLEFFVYFVKFDVYTVCQTFNPLNKLLYTHTHMHKTFFCSQTIYRCFFFYLSNFSFDRQKYFSQINFHVIKHLLKKC